MESYLQKKRSGRLIHLYNSDYQTKWDYIRLLLLEKASNLRTCDKNQELFIIADGTHSTRTKTIWGVHLLSFDLFTTAMEILKHFQRLVHILLITREYVSWLLLDVASVKLCAIQSSGVCVYKSYQEIKGVTIVMS